MPSQRLRLTKTEDQQDRALLSELRKMGIEIGSAGPPAELARLTLEQSDYELAEVCELPSGAIAAVVPAKMTVLSSGILITDAEMTTPWDEFPLDLSEPESSAYYEDLIGRMYHSPPRVLNHWLTHHVPLRPRQEEGVIFAHGWSPVPPECHDGTLVTVKLSLFDQRRNELRFDFETRVDRSVKRKHERQQQQRRDVAASTKRLFEREDRSIQDQDRPIQQQGSGPISPSPVVVSIEKPREGSSTDVPRDETDETSGAV